MRRIIALAVVVLLQGGAALNSISSAGVAATVGSAVNPAVGLVAGVATAYGVDQGIKYGERRTHDDVQQAIADAAGPRWATSEPAVRRWGTLQ